MTLTLAEDRINRHSLQTGLVIVSEKMTIIVFSGISTDLSDLDLD